MRLIYQSNLTNESSIKQNLRKNFHFGLTFSCYSIFYSFCGWHYRRPTTIIIQIYISLVKEQFKNAHHINACVTTIMKKSKKNVKLYFPFHISYNCCKSLPLLLIKYALHLELSRQILKNILLFLFTELFLQVFHQPLTRLFPHI